MSGKAGMSEKLINAASSDGTTQANGLHISSNASLPELITTRSSRASSIGLSDAPVPVTPLSPAVGSEAEHLSFRLSYYRTLTGRMGSADRALLEPPAGVLQAATIATLAAIVPRGEGGKTGSAGLIFTIWNTMMGSTLLVMPYTFNESGWALGLFLSAFCAMVAQFTCGLILKYGATMMMDPTKEMSDLAGVHYGAVGYGLTLAVGNFVVLGAACAMQIYMSTVAAHLVSLPPESGGLGIGVWGEGNRNYCIALLALVLPLANLPTIETLAKLNTVGVFCFIIMLCFAYTSAIASYAEYGLNPVAFESASLAKPASAGVVFGIFSLSFFIHNAVMTIMRGAAEPKKNKRNMTTAFSLTWFCYASMGVSANLFPPLGDVAALASDAAKSGMLSMKQPAAMAPFLVVARLAVLIQCISVYPVLLFIIRSQIFTAFVYRRPYPGPLPTFLISSAMAVITTTCTYMQVHVSDVLRFAGAGGALVIVFGLPALIHAKVSYELGKLTPLRIFTCLMLCSFGVFCVVEQLIPQPGAGAPASPPAPHAPPHVAALVEQLVDRLAPQ